MCNTLDVVRNIWLISLFYFQVSVHSSVISVELRSPKRVTCSATSSCTQGRSPLSVPFAVMPVEDEMHLLVIFVHMQVRHILV